MISFIKSFVKHQIFKFKFNTCVIGLNSNISNSSKLGDYVAIFRHVSIIDSEVGSYTYIQSNSIVNNAFIGRYSSIATNVSIGGGEHPIDFIGTSPVFYDNNHPLPKFLVSGNNYNKPYINRTNIGADVWIGQNSIIKSGINIGVGAIVGAGAVVVKDVEPYSIVGGVPAKHIKWRFDESLREKLSSSKWWTLNPVELEGLNEYFSNPELMMQQLAKTRNI